MKPMIQIRIEKGVKGGREERKSRKTDCNDVTGAKGIYESVN